jgi:phosphoribosylformylglycinamidine cyclo-ligase
MTGREPGDAYAKAGVDQRSEEAALKRMLHWINQTLAFGPTPTKMPVGAFANVVALDEKTGLAISCDSVGTKILVAQQVGKYDTVGIDCVAMNVNDLICIGARPLALVDALAVESIDADALEAIAKGLYEGARLAGVSIPGGEIAQLRDMIRGHEGGYAFDLVGTAVGTVRLDEIITGKDARPGDVILGLKSSGLHSNGYTLARRVLFQQAGMRPDQYVKEFGRSLGEELLEPTRIYVRETMEILSAGLPVHGLANITGDGLLNLSRLEAAVGCEITDLPEPQPIFKMIQRLGNLPDEEMYRVFNMGVGFCIVMPDDEKALKQAAEICARHGSECFRIGAIVADDRGSTSLTAGRRVFLRQKNLVGEVGAFRQQ